MSTDSKYRPTLAQSRVLEHLNRLDDETIIEWVPIADMIDGGNYGRPISSAQIGRMAAKGFNKRKAGIITLSLRPNGKFAVVDGSHRRNLAESQGVTHLLARIFVDLSYEEEAELFEALSTTKPPTALDRFRARIEYRDPEALKIVEILSQHDLFIPNTLGGRNAFGGVTAVYELEKTYVALGPEGLGDILDILIQAWDRDHTAFTGKIFGGMRQFMLRYGEQVDKQDLATRLSKIAPTRVLIAANAMSTSTDSTENLVGRQIRMIYNSRRRTRMLSEWPERVAPSTPDQNTQKRLAGERILSRIQKARGVKLEEPTTEE